MTRTPLSAPESAPYRSPNSDLGQPMSIREVAGLLGCSVWSVRQRLLPKGLPHFRSGPSGKIVFFRHQVVAWILAQQAQMKGGESYGRWGPRT
jgi:hypothetical protein